MVSIQTKTQCQKRSKGIEKTGLPEICWKHFLGSYNQKHKCEPISIMLFLVQQQKVLIITSFLSVIRVLYYGVRCWAIFRTKLCCHLDKTREKTHTSIFKVCIFLEKVLYLFFFLRFTEFASLAYLFYYFKHKSK